MKLSVLRSDSSAWSSTGIVLLVDNEELRLQQDISHGRGVLQVLLPLVAVIVSKSQELEENSFCLNKDPKFLQFYRCSGHFIGRTLSQNDLTILRCPRHSFVLLISIHSRGGGQTSSGCKVKCPINFYHDGCHGNNTCILKSSDFWQRRGCYSLNIEISYICMKKLNYIDQDLRRRNLTSFCSAHLYSFVSQNSSNQEKLMSTKTTHSSSLPWIPKLPLTSVQPRNRLNSLETNSTFYGYSRAWKSNLRKREADVNDTARLDSREDDSGNVTDVTTVTRQNETEGTTQYLLDNDTFTHNFSEYKESFIGRQISLWFASINEPHLISVFIKSNIEKFVLYLVVFLCIGVISVMAVVIYSLAHQIKHKRTYVVNKKNSLQHKQGKISYHSPNNWRTPESGSSTGDDRTLHDEEVNTMDRTDSGHHVMCSSMTETRSNEEENQLAHQPLSNSARGSTTLPSPPNSLIFERASPTVPSDIVETSESPSIKPDTPFRAEEVHHFVDHLS